MNLSPERKDSLKKHVCGAASVSQSVIETLSCLVLTLLSEH